MLAKKIHAHRRPAKQGRFLQSLQKRLGCILDDHQVEIAPFARFISGLGAASRSRRLEILNFPGPAEPAALRSRRFFQVPGHSSCRLSREPKPLIAEIVEENPNCPKKLAHEIGAQASNSGVAQHVPGIVFRRRSSGCAARSGAIPCGEARGVRSRIADLARFPGRRRSTCRGGARCPP